MTDTSVTTKPRPDMFPNANAYETLMGRWSERLAPLFVDFARIVDEGNAGIDADDG